MGYPIFKDAKTSVGVSDSLDFYPAAHFTKHRILVSAVGTPTAGTLTVKVDDHGLGLRGLTATISLTSPQPYVFEGPYSQIQITPSGITGATAYKVGVTSWMGR